MTFDRDDFREYTKWVDHHNLKTHGDFIIPPPIIIEKTARGERNYDLWSRLMEDRIVMVGSPIVDFVSAIVTGQLLFLQKDNKTQDIQVYINSPGGSVTAGLAIYDTMQFVQPDVMTCCIGMCASMGAVLLAGGAKGKRFSLPHSRIMIHQPWGGVGGTAADIAVQTEEILREKQILLDILVSHTGRDRDQLKKDCERDKFMSPVEAVEYGIIDEVITTLKQDKPVKPAAS